MPSKLEIPKTITEKTKVLLKFASGNVVEFNPRDIEPFLNTIHDLIDKKGVLKIVANNTIDFVNLSCVEMVTIEGEAVVTKTYRNKSNENNLSRKPTPVTRKAPNFKRT